MKLHKICVVLLALLLAAMVMVPMVSAADRPMYGVDWSKVAPTEPVDEKELLTIIISEKDFTSRYSEKDDAFITMPVVDSRQKTDTNDPLTYYSILGNITDSEQIVVIQLPKKMYEKLSEDNKDSTVLIPKEFVSNYPSIAEFKKISADRKEIIKKIIREIIQSLNLPLLI